jgi:hypothetical protein
MPPHSRKLKFLQFFLGNGESPDEQAAFQCQVQTWRIVNNTPDGDKMYGFCYDPELTDAENEAAGEFREEAEPDYALEVTFHADWRSGGISDFLWAHDGETVTWRIDHHPNDLDSHVAWEGTLKVKAPSVGGEVRTSEMTEWTSPIIGKPTYLGPGVAS